MRRACSCPKIVSTARLDRFYVAIPSAVLVDIVAAGSTMSMFTNLPNPFGHVPVAVAISSKSRLLDGPPPILSWVLSTFELQGVLGDRLQGIDPGLPVSIRFLARKTPRAKRAPNLGKFCGVGEPSLLVSFFAGASRLS
eukprot:7138876-Pyramimonas_sp.AAC.1